MLEIFYCDECKSKLCECGDIAFALFEHICEQYFDGQPLELSTCVHDRTHSYLEIIRYLEIKGFVVTTESGENLIQVKPIGLRQVDELFLFCLDRKDEE
jgi:hypothetical protein